MKFIVKANATTANIGSGFDCSGLALDLKNEILVSDEGDEPLVIRAGAGVPTDESNLIYRAMTEVFAAVGRFPKSVTIEQTDRIPMASGLGSSAACVAAGLTAANVLTGNALSFREIIDLAAKIDGHPDNVLPCLVSGATAAVMKRDGSGVEEFIRVDLPGNLFAAALTPNFPLETQKARKVLPEVYPKADVVYSLSRAVVSFAALAVGDAGKLACVDDKLHQPYRIPLIPGYNEAVGALKDANAICAFLSGAGPTVLGIFKETPGLSRDSLALSAPSGWTTRVLNFDNNGVVTEKIR